MSPNQRVTLVGMVSHPAYGRARCKPPHCGQRPVPELLVAFTPHHPDSHAHIPSVFVQWHGCAGQAGGDLKPPSKSRLVGV